MPSPKSRSLSTLLQFAEDHQELQKPFVVFKYPNEPLVRAIFQEDAILLTSPDFDRSGFVFAPFGEDMPVVVVRADRTIESPLENVPAVSDAGIVDQQSHAEAGRYRDLVSRAVQVIRTGVLKKVVLSRRVEVPTSKSLLEIFRGLISTYPSAFCYCWHHPGIGSWAGATPEIFLQVSGGQFSTVALAGTLEREGQETPKWGLKEKEEQRLVTDYIKEVLSARGIKVQESEVQTVEAGSLWHLKTTLSGHANPENIPALISALHPTPAVCGTPLDDARKFILNHEGYTRKYYTGFLGEINPEGEGQTRLFVNLRCMELQGSTAHVFVGGGVTVDSDPGKEWQETRAKSKTIIRVL